MGGKADDNRVIHVGLIGTGVMGRAHSIAYSIIPMIFDTGYAIAKEAVADMTGELAQAGARQFGYHEWTGRWEEVVENEKIDVIDICTPNDLHMPIALAAAGKGKHIVCEKPLALNLEETKRLYQTVEEANVKHCVAFNYRMAPAVLEARKIIEDGALGELYHFRGSYLQDFAIDKDFPLVWRFESSKAGSGALGDIGSHIIDYARFLVGEPVELSAMGRTFVQERPLPGQGKLGKVDVDDAVSILLSFDNGAIGTIEASRFYHGRKNQLSFEISGSKGSLFFDWERRNELLLYSADAAPGRQGFTTIITGPNHPYGGILWPIPGLGMSYIETTVVLLQRFLNSIVEDSRVSPDFYDGLKTAEIMDAALVSQQQRKWVTLNTQ